VRQLDGHRALPDRGGHSLDRPVTHIPGGDPPPPLGAVDLKGVAKPLPLYQAFRRS